MLVILRLSLGCHFLYEGLWKVTLPDFSAEGFLTQAKGPAAGIFHAMIPDADGRKRLKIEPVVHATELRGACKKLRDDAEIRYRRKLEKPYKKKLKKDEEISAADQMVIVREVDNFNQASMRPLWQFQDKLGTFLAKNQDKLLPYLIGARTAKSADNDPDRVEQLKGWLSELTEMEKQYHAALGEVVAKYMEGSPPEYNAWAPAGDDDLPVEEIVADGAIRNVKGRPLLLLSNAITGAPYTGAWKQLQDEVVRKYRFDEQQALKAMGVYQRFAEGLETYLDENQGDIVAYFGSLDRFEAQEAAGNNRADYKKKRTWDRRQELRREAKQWLSAIDKMEQSYHDALWQLLDEEQRNQGALPVAWTQTDLLNLAVSWGLTAIGVCLILGLATRPAALGGAAFMFMILLTQPAWPTIYPPAPEVVGHALLVDKNFIEMIALLVVATTAAGRWGGLDFFAENFVIRMFCWLKKRLFKAKQTNGKENG